MPISGHNEQLTINGGKNHQQQDEVCAGLIKEYNGNVQRRMCVTDEMCRLG